MDCDACDAPNHALPCTPHQVLEPSNPAPPQTSARCTLRSKHSPAHTPEHVSKWGVIWGGVAYLLRSPLGPLIRSPASPDTPRKCSARRICTRRRNGYAGCPAGQLHTFPCAACPCVRGRQWHPCAAQSAAKMGEGVGEYGCKRRQGDVQPLPGTWQDPVPVWGRFLPQFRAENARVYAQRQSGRNVRHE